MNISLQYSKSSQDVLVLNDKQKVSFYNLFEEYKLAFSLNDEIDRSHQDPFLFYEKQKPIIRKEVSRLEKSGKPRRILWDKLYQCF